MSLNYQIKYFVKGVRAFNLLFLNILEDLFEGTIKSINLTNILHLMQGEGDFNAKEGTNKQ